MTRPTYEVQVGERYGSLVVTEIGFRAEPNAAQLQRGHQGPRAAWTLCDCGRTRLAEVGRLVVGKTTSCGECAASPAPVRRPRGGRPAKVIDTSPFEAVMAEALVAYTLDVGLCELMMINAVQIQGKRLAWKIRKELRQADERARAECEAAGPRTCVVTEPCGCGPCPYARGDHADLVGVPSLPAKTSSTNRTARPQPRPEHVPGHIYSVEAALLPLIELRTSRGTLNDTATPQEQRTEAKDAITGQRK